MELVEPAVEPWRTEKFMSFAYGDEGELYTAHFGWEKRFGSSEQYAIAPQFALALAENTDDEIVLVNAFDLVLRQYVYQAEDLGMFLEIAGGLQYTGPESYPRSGTHANFRLRGGAGMNYRLDENLDLLAGVNWFHISNANVLDPNVGHDGPMLYLGLRCSY